MTKEQELQMSNYYSELVQRGKITTLSEASVFKLSYEKAFSLHSVSQQRELLVAWEKRRYSLEEWKIVEKISIEFIDDWLSN
jgi:hypothetical protein